MTEILVYGSLKMGERLHEAMGGAIFVDVGKIKGSLFDLGPYPAATPEILPGTTGEIHGEVFTVSPSIMRRLDQIEGHPVYYERKPVTEILTGREVWVYFLPKLGHKARLIADGKWSGKNGGMVYV